ncbi:GNAT family N-acetyltransferase [Streptomyces rectiverticillatus]|uniref:GNAT family N-acetyltransferase n=1 Tax=Streptomyces rectiverticillatus TaxID=173860 RepID=UPI0015C3F686|nr:GNAT family N-acetyltransferase [Streptomyces rectiverticillatus]
MARQASIQPESPQKQPQPQHDIEALRPAQWSLLRELRLHALGQDGTVFDASPETEAALPASYWQEVLATSTIWVATAGDAPAGMVRYTPHDGYGHGGSLWIDPHGRTRGLARRLMLTAVDHARRRGDSELRGSVLPDNRPAVRLFRSLGAVPTGWLKPRNHPPHALRIEMSIPLSQCPRT